MQYTYAWVILELSHAVRFVEALKSDLKLRKGSA